MFTPQKEREDADVPTSDSSSHLLAGIGKMNVAESSDDNQTVPITGSQNMVDQIPIANLSLATSTIKYLANTNISHDLTTFRNFDREQNRPILRFTDLYLNRSTNLSQYNNSKKFINNDYLNKN